VNVAKTAWNVATIPYKAAYNVGKTVLNVPFQETQAIRSLFSDPSAQARAAQSPQAAAQVMDPTYYPPGQAPQPWSSQPYAAQPSAPQYGSSPPSYPAQAPYYGGMPQQYAAPAPDYGPDPTGWAAAYGGDSPGY
jgi:hypothetical protein